MISLAWTDKTLTELFIAFDYGRRMKKVGISHIHCHFGDRKFFIGYYCKKLTGLPLSLTVHAHEIYANPNEKFFSKAVHIADKIIAISDKNRTLLIKNYNVDPEKIRTFFNQLFKNL